MRGYLRHPPSAERGGRTPKSGRCCPERCPTEDLASIRWGDFDVSGWNKWLPEQGWPNLVGSIAYGAGCDKIRPQSSGRLRIDCRTSSNWFQLSTAESVVTRLVEPSQARPFQPRAAAHTSLAEASLTGRARISRSPGRPCVGAPNSKACGCTTCDTRLRRLARERLSASRSSASSSVIRKRRRRPATPIWTLIRCSAQQTSSATGLRAP